MENNSPLIITGMHRSGTSLIARFIHHSGINLGNNLLDASKSNLYGHFEDVEILEFQRSILEREFGHQMWVPNLPRLTDTDKTNALMLIAKRKQNPYWGWKEPRTCLFLDFWYELLPNAHFLFIVRNPISVLNSLSRRTGTKFYQFWKHNIFLKSWLFYNDTCFQFYRKHRSRHTMVTLERVLQKPDKFVNLLSKRLSIQFDIQVFHTLYDPAALTRQENHLPLASLTLYLQSLFFYSRLRQIDNLC